MCVHGTTALGALHSLVESPLPSHLPSWDWLPLALCVAGEYLHIRELRTTDNIRLDNEDQVLAVCRPDETLVVVLGTGSEPEVGPGDMVSSIDPAAACGYCAACLCSLYIEAELRLSFARRFPH
jgi:hypothetical protein